MVYLLSLVDYQVLEKVCEVDVECYENLFDEVVNLFVCNLQVDLVVIEGDESKKVCNDDFLKLVLKDSYICEVLLIIYDIIELEGVVINDQVILVSWFKKLFNVEGCWVVFLFELL